MPINPQGLLQITKPPTIKSMKKLVSTLSCVAIFASSSLFGQGSVATDPVGYVSKKDLPAGGHILSAPLLNTVSGAGVVTEINGEVVTLSFDLTSPNPIPEPAFIHVVDSESPALGQISTILSVDGSAATLETAIAGLEVNDRIQIRPHFTNGDIIAAAGGVIADNTTLRCFNADGSSTSFRAGDNQWFPSGSFVPENDAIIFPGEGFVIRLQEVTTLTFVGGVSVAPISVPVTAGVVNIIGSVNPSEGDEVEGTTIGQILAGLGTNTTLRVFAEDGSLSSLESYRLGDGAWFPSGSFTPDDVKVASPKAVVLRPQTSGTVELTPAYTN